MGETLFQSFRTLDAEAAQKCLENLKTVVSAATRSQQEFFTRLFWFAYRTRRFEQLSATIGALKPALRGLGLTTPAPPTVDSEVAAWRDLVDRVEYAIQAARQIGDYSRKLMAL